MRVYSPLVDLNRQGPMMHRQLPLMKSVPAILIMTPWGCSGTTSPSPRDASNWAADALPVGSDGASNASGVDGATLSLGDAGGGAAESNLDSDVSDSFIGAQVEPGHDTGANRDTPSGNPSGDDTAQIDATAIADAPDDARADYDLWSDSLSAAIDAPAPTDAATPLDNSLRDGGKELGDLAAGEVHGGILDGGRLGDVDAFRADAGDQIDTATPAARTLSLVLQGAPWKNGQNARGLAADAAHRVYRMDDNNIYRVEGSTVITYFTLADALNQVGLENAGYFLDLDLDPSDLLYIMLIGTQPTTGTSATFVAQSSGPQLATKWRDLSTYTASRMGVITSGKVGFIDYSGLWTGTATSESLVYAASLLQDVANCAMQGIATAHSGVFLYLPGCNGSPLLRGNADGSGVAVLYQVSSSPINGSNFLCSARDPAGGFYIMAVQNIDGSGIHMYHVAENANGSTGLTQVVTVPSFDQARNSQTEMFAFRYCSLATAADGTVYFQTMSQLWQVSR